MRQLHALWQKRSTKWLLLPLAIPALRPFFYGIPTGHDTLLHFLRVMILEQHLQNGMLFPRWVPELVLGYGYPLFNFYSPAVYYLGAAFSLLGLSYTQAYTIVHLLLMAAAGWGMWTLASDLFKREKPLVQQWAALLAAVAYLYTPYLHFNLYQRGALPEAAAQALLPWIFWCFGRLQNHPEPKRYFLPAVFCLAGLALTHNITLLLFPPFFIIYLLVNAYNRSPQQQWANLRWPLLAGATAVGLSAFFWLPAVAERPYLLDVATAQATSFFEQYAWRWDTFLDTHWRYAYSREPLPQLGLWQLILSFVGAIAVRRFDRPWLYWIGMVVVGSLGISAWATPLWISNDITLIAQFPWRLLSVVSVGLALLTAGCVPALSRLSQQPWLTITGTAALLLLIIYTQGPQLAWSNTRAPITLQPDHKALAFYEAETTAYGTSLSQEFMPRWVDPQLVDQPFTAAEETPSLNTIQLHEAGPWAMRATITAAEPTALHWRNFYFPNWQVFINDTAVEPYPSTPLGLLTVSIPAGTHDITMTWRATQIQIIAGWLSGLTLVIWLIILLYHQRWGESAVMGVCLAIGIWGIWSQPTTNPQFQAVEGQLTDEPVQLLGYTAEQISPHELNLHAYWYIHENSPSFQPRWELQNEAGLVVGHSETAAYYGTLTPNNWPPGTIVDDVYRIPLAPNTAAGQYRLQLAINPNAPTTTVGAILLTEATPDTQTQTQSGILFAEKAQLIQVEVFVNGRSAPADLPVINGGDYLEYRLYWRGARPLAKNYHSSLLLTDAAWNPIAQVDHTIGFPFQMTQSWVGKAPQDAIDVYRFVIPRDASSGLYWPRLAVYDGDDLTRLTVSDGDGQAYGDSYSLPPFKLFNEHRVALDTAAAVTLADQNGPFAELIGYEITPAALAIQAGDALTLTVAYRAGEIPTTADYKQFVHLYSDALGMAAQADQQPRSGNNPTTVWQPHEQITDQFVLSIADTVEPGVYTLYIGLYNEAGRVVAQDEEGLALADGRIKLAEITIYK